MCGLGNIVSCREESGNRILRGSLRWQVNPLAASLLTGSMSLPPFFVPAFPDWEKNSSRYPDFLQVAGLTGSILIYTTDAFVVGFSVLCCWPFTMSAQVK